MIWHVDGHDVEVFVSGVSEVEIHLWTKDEKVISVPCTLSKDEVRWTIRNIHKDRYVLAHHSKKYDELVVFGKRWSVELKKGTGRAYLSGGIIYCYTNRKSISCNLTMQIKKQLLEQFILSFIGIWEDRFEKLVPQIMFRRDARNPFVIGYDHHRITFDKGLDRFPLIYVEYCVFDALSSFFGVDKQERELYLVKYFSSVKTIQKTLKYEYRSTNRD